MELLWRATGCGLGTQGDPQVMGRLFEVRLQRGRPPERRDGAGRVAVGFELLAEVTLRLRIFGIDFDRLAELDEGSRAIALAAQCYAQQRVRPCQAGIKAQGAAKLGRGGVQIAELS